MDTNPDLARASDEAWDHFCLAVTAMVDRGQYVDRYRASPPPDAAHLGAVRTLLAGAAVAPAHIDRLADAFATWARETLPEVFPPDGAPPTARGRQLRVIHEWMRTQASTWLRPEEAWTALRLAGYLERSGRTAPPGRP